MVGYRLRQRRAAGREDGGVVDESGEQRRYLS
jgi:hypothetical protein